MSKATSNSSKKTQDAENPAKLDPEILGKIVTLRSQVRESFGKIVMALMGLPRYRHLSLCDLQPMILEPLIRDRLAIAQPKAAENSDLADIAGFAIWASVSEEVDAKIREQIKAGSGRCGLTPSIGHLARSTGCST